jgi:NAD(P)-dependent dehydrogenase (short-subunit alcohol dehydrogenase family)
LGNKLEGKIAVITGGASGIGLATVKRFVLEGAYVFIFDRNKKELELALSEIGKNVVGVEGDVSNVVDLDRLYEVVKDQKGYIDIVFANSGIIQFAPLGRL